jgi:hypothetical protein
MESTSLLVDFVMGYGILLPYYASKLAESKDMESSSLLQG